MLRPRGQERTLHGDRVFLQDRLFTPSPHGDIVQHHARQVPCRMLQFLEDFGTGFEGVYRGVREFAAHFTEELADVGTDVEH